MPRIFLFLVVALCLAGCLSQTSQTPPSRVVTGALPPPSLTGLSNSSKSFTPWQNMSAASWRAPSEIRRTWDAAIVQLPRAEKGGVRTQMRHLAAAPTDTISGQYPLVIYLHGCDGLGAWSLRYMDMFAGQGYAVIAPASMARTRYPISCNPATNEGGLYDGSVRMRAADAEYTIAEARKLPWVDPENIFVVGYSQGGTTTAFLKTPGKPALAGRVIVANTCTNRWPGQRYHAGVNAPESEPVLALLGVRDPWFVNNQWAKGDCGASLSKTNGSKNVVFTSGAIANSHDLLDFPQGRAEVFAFMAANKN